MLPQQGAAGVAAMDSGRFCTVHPSWDADCDIGLEEVTVFRIEKTGDDGNDTEDPGPPLQQKGIYLRAPGVVGEGDTGVATCTLTIQTKPQYKLAITAVDVLSDSRHLEVYSERGEYLSTCAGVRVDLEVDKKVFLTQHSFDDPVKACTLKCMSPSWSKGSLWVHSVHVTLSAEGSGVGMEGVSGMVSTGCIDMGKVRSLLSGMATPMSDKAQALLQAVETLQKNKSETAQDNMAAMASMMSMFARVSHRTEPQPENLDLSVPPEGAAGKMAQTALPLKPEVQGFHPIDVACVQGSSTNTGMRRMDHGNAGGALQGSAASGNMSSKDEKLASGRLEEASRMLDPNLVVYLQAMERHLLAAVSIHVSAAENRIHQKLDQILALLEGDSQSSKVQTDNLKPD